MNVGRKFLFVPGASICLPFVADVAESAIVDLRLEGFRPLLGKKTEVKFR